MRNRWSRWLLFWSVCLLAGASWPARAEGLVLGVVPHVAASQLAGQYFPLRDLVARTLRRPVTLLSAPDERTFAERTQRGDFDLVLTAPHLARRAERAGWRRVVQTGYQLEVVILARAGSELQQLADLRGHTLAIGPRDSYAYRIVAADLAREGLALEQDVPVLTAPGFNDVMYALQRGDATAGTASRLQWRKATQSQHAAAREIHVAPPMPGYFVMAHPRLAEADLAALRRALSDFRETALGQLYFRKTDQIDFRPIDDATTQRVDTLEQNENPPRADQ